jgi:predicted metal-dependent enzyme (double-stranded beta helix superfamily)
MKDVDELDPSVDFLRWHVKQVHKDYGNRRLLLDQQLLSPVKAFVENVRGYFQEELDPSTLWYRASDDLQRLLKSPELLENSQNWPTTKEPNGPPGNLLFYEDPDYKFVLNALVKKPLAETTVHDHGQSWTLYGVLEGGEHIRRWRRVDDGPKERGPAVLSEDGTFDVTPGYIDIVPPWQIHQEKNGNHRTIGFIVRSQRSGTFRQYRYNLEDGSMGSNQGPHQIPYQLT